MKDIKKLGGITLLKLYDNIPSSIFEKVLPENNWLPWKFQNPRTVWKDTKFQRKFLDWIAKQLQIIEPSDWYNVSEPVITR
jgi:hypothetical protein